MKLTRQSVLTASSLIIGGIIGASALVALADNTWVSAPTLTNPVTCDSSINGCNPPINVGSVTQTKAAGLTIQGLLSTNGFLFHPSGTTVPVGSVLTAQDTSGTAIWASSTAAVVKSNGWVGWSEQFTPNGTVVKCIAGGSALSGHCTSTTVWGVFNQVNVSCDIGSITDTIVSITNTYGGGYGVETVVHKGYCVQIQ